MVCSRRAPGSHIIVDIQWHYETGVSLLPHTGHWTRGLPSKCCIVHWLNIPSLYASHRHWASASSVFDRLLIPLQEWRRPTTIFHWAPLGNRRGKKGDRRYFWWATLVSWPPGRWTQFLAWVLSVACLHVLALSRTSRTTRWRLKFKRGFHSSGQVPGWRGGLDWRNRRSCTGFWAEQQDCSTRTAQGHSSWHIV